MTLTAETKDPKFGTRLVLKQFCIHSDHGLTLRRNTVIKIILASTEPYRRGSIMKAITRAWYGMEWKMEWKFRYGIWKMQEWNGMEDFKNGMEDNLPY